MESKCESSMHYFKPWRRILSKILHGHSMHTCVETHNFMAIFPEPCRCSCGATWNVLLGKK